MATVFSCSAALLFGQGCKKQAGTFEDLKIAPAKSYFQEPLPLVAVSNAQITTPAPSSSSARGRKSVNAVPHVAPANVSMRPQVALPPQSPKQPQARVREVALKLDQPQTLFVAGQNIPIELHDYGAETIGVRIHGRLTRITKQTNPNPNEMSELTMIHQVGAVRVYHLDTPEAPIGCFVARIVGETN